MDICCTLTGTYPAYIAGALTSYYRTTPAIGALYIARTTSNLLDNIYRKAYTFKIGDFQFRLTEWGEYENFSDESIYAITFQDVTVNFSLTIVDVSVSCGSKSSINFTEFIWDYICSFTFKMYAIVCVPFDTPTFLYFNHHRATSDGWKSFNYCDDFQSLMKPFVGNCTSEPSCQCPVSLRQPPSLRNLASHTVFHFTFNLSPFTLSNRTLYHQYLYAVESATVSEDELIPNTFFPYSELKCIFFYGIDAVHPIRHFTMTASSLLNATGPQRTPCSVRALRRLLRCCVTTKNIGGAISALDPYSQHDPVCNTMFVYLLFLTFNLLILSLHIFLLSILCMYVT